MAFEDHTLANLDHYLERYEQVMRGKSAAFGSRLDRGWVPPTLEDVAAEQQATGGE